MGFKSFFKGLGKGLLKVAPIAAAFIPGIGPLASAGISAATGAASGAISGGKKGALIGGLLGGATGGIGKALSGASGAVKMGANGIPNIGVTNGISSLPGVATGGGALVNGLMNAGKSAIKGVGGNLVQSLLNPNVLDSAGQGVGAIAQTQASNRGTELDAMMEADRQKMQLARDRATDEEGMMKKIQQAEYLKSGGMPARPQSFSANGKPFTQFASGMKPITEGTKAAASTLEDQLQARLKTPPTLRDYDSKMKPGAMESTLDWLGPILSTGAQVQKARQPVTPSMLMAGQPKPPVAPLTPNPTAAPLPPPVPGARPPVAPAPIEFGDDWSNR